MCRDLKGEFVVNSMGRVRTLVTSQVLEYRRAAGLLFKYTPFSNLETRGCWPARTLSTSICVIESDLSVFAVGTVFL